MADDNQLLTIYNAGIINVKPGVPNNKALISADITRLFISKPGFNVINATNIKSQIRIGNYYTYEIPPNSITNCYEYVKDYSFNQIEYLMHSSMQTMFMIGIVNGNNIDKYISLNSGQIGAFVDLGTYEFDNSCIIIGLLV